MSIALYDFVPYVCPVCGRYTKLKDPDNLRDYKANASQTCHGCGLQFQYADTDAMLKVATSSGGDLEQYHGGR
jgi:hypothetical protein